MEGKITFNPQRFPIFFIPPNQFTSPPPLLTVDRTQWDLYLVMMPFTLHGTASNSYYQEVTFFVSLTNREATAYDLFPKNVTTEMREMKSYTLSPQFKFHEVQLSLGKIYREIRFDSLRPTIRAFGKAESRFYWVYKGFAEQKEVIPETKHALVVLQVARGTKLVEGFIQYEVVIAKRRLDVWKSKACNVNSYPIRWELSAAPPFFMPGIPPRDDTATSVAPVHTYAINNSSTFDACIICAMAEEADALMKETENLYNVTLHQGISSLTGREYRHTTITNYKGERLSLRFGEHCLIGIGE